MAVVVTGLGLVTPLGVQTAMVWDKLLSGYSGIRTVNFDVAHLPVSIGGVIDDDDIDSYYDPADKKKMGRFIRYAIAAATEALNMANWSPSSEKECNYTGVSIGSAIGGLDNIYNQSIFVAAEKKITPFFLPSTLSNLAAGHVAIKFRCKGPNLTASTACSSGAHAICDAAMLIEAGKAKVMIAGGSESVLSKLGIAGFCALKALSTAFNDDPAKASRPWDINRDGFVIADGAGVLILEDEEHALQRGATIYARLVGSGMSCDAYHPTAPHDEGDGAYSAMQMAIKEARIDPSQIGYVNAHSTSTPLGDVAELKAISRVFRGCHETLVSSTKGSVGHMIGAAGAVEAIFSILAMMHSKVPYTLNLEQPCDTDMDLVMHSYRTKHLEYVLSNSFAFGGTNVTLLFGRP